MAVVPCITTSPPFPWVCTCTCTSHTFLVWLILWLTRTLSRVFSELFCHTFVGRFVSSIQKDGIRNERGPVGLGDTAFEGLDFLK